ncbi:uncharacterized protein PGTG_04448 [Puccinia graminis f. sp. tritici CRL 75-36-700-3]|uniref:Uncharacterized protein n=1 Tax=Puccinia graminis f. sp. tritici (strain CRL 75-36-700-3 / race SCCL) TaxID=418459 RepID=E3K2C3_PUCGT|nr:uncharacterized protein PGTG_04448 [Puccinia graminis f. sp. tritici CRL 75-36-700-3]EFP78492.2 hypothetical protein PGTG_04448 [Puccinia graminis f. sp. tritici CRL 75-36-700-3]
MDPFQACQFLQKFIGKSSSSATELLGLLSALVPINDVITSSKAPEKVLATASTESAGGLGGSLSQFTPAFPVQVSKEALASIFDISFIAIDVKVTTYHRYWVERLIRLRLGERLASYFGPKDSPNSMPPMNIKLSFRFVANFDVECYEASITYGEEASVMGLPSIIAHLPVKPIYFLDWGIHKYDPQAARTDPPRFIESQLPRLVEFMKSMLKRAIRVQRAKDRAALLYTPRILDHIQKKVSTLESRSGIYSEAQNDKVKQLRSKLDMFYATPAFRIQAAMDSMIGMVNPNQAVDFAKTIGGVVHPSQVINLTNTFGNVGKFDLTSRGEQSLNELLPVVGGKPNSDPKVPQGESQAGTSKPNLPAKPQTRLTMLNFKLPDILQAILLAIVTEVYGVLLKYPTGLTTIFERFFDVLLERIHPDHSQNANFSLSGPSLPFGMPSLPSFDGAMGLSVPKLPLDMPNMPSFNGTIGLSASGLPVDMPSLPSIGLSSPMGLPGMPTINPLDSILKPAVPLDNVLSTGTSNIDLRPSVGRLSSSLMTSGAKSPLNLRTVSWGTNPSDTECDATETDLKDSAVDSKNRKLLPKSPKPKTHLGMAMKNAAISKPPLEPIQLVGESFKDHSVANVSQGNLPSLGKNDSDKEN